MQAAALGSSLGFALVGGILTGEKKTIVNQTYFFVTCRKEMMHGLIF